MENTINLNASAAQSTAKETSKETSKTTSILKK